MTRKTTPANARTRWLTTEEAADLIGVITPKTLTNWRYLPVSQPAWKRVGGRVRYREADVLAWLDALPDGRVA